MSQTGLAKVFRRGICLKHSSGRNQPLDTNNIGFHGAGGDDIAAAEPRARQRRTIKSG
jgi:hypothetical protein